jgi:heme/copper-type cytochrome/quinol oxidase subunit 4
MRHHFRFVAILAVCLIAYAVLVGGFHLMSQPRDSALLGGIAIIFALLICVPLLVRMIWRNL